MTCLDLRFMGNQMTRESCKREEAKGRNRREDKRRQTDRSGEGEQREKGERGNTRTGSEKETQVE